MMHRSGNSKSGSIFSIYADEVKKNLAVCASPAPDGTPRYSRMICRENQHSDDKPHAPERDSQYEMSGQIDNAGLRRLLN